MIRDLSSALAIAALAILCGLWAAVFAAQLGWDAPAAGLVVLASIVQTVLVSLAGFVLVPAVVLGRRPLG